MRGSKLTKRFLLVVVTIIIAIVAAFYLYSVPLIKSTVFDIELNASRIALNNVFELAKEMQTSTQEYKSQVLASHRRQLRTVVNMAAFFYDKQVALAEDSGMTREQARAYALQQMRDLKYGDGDYIWIADEHSRLIAHPDPRYQGQNTRNILDENGQPIIPPVVKTAIKDGEGFYKYRWHRLSDDQPLEKFSYVKYFPQWHFVIGSGVYIDDVQAEVEARRKQALSKLRKAFSEIKIANTGYLFIFDKRGRMLVHPNQNIDGIDFQNLKNPVTGHPIMQDLIAVADTGHELNYKWDRPSDPGHYVYDKVSLVRFLPGFNWYICSSVYLDELQASSQVLSDRILTIACIALLAATALAMVFVVLVTRPIRQLSETAHQISNGQLDATTGIVRGDEIGTLARAFDRMVERLRHNIRTLDEKVGQRTAELHERNRQLHQAMDEVTAANRNLELVEERQRLILDALPAQVAYIDDRQRYVFANRGYAESFDRQKDDIIGRHLRDVVGHKMYSDIREPVESALAGIASSFEYPREHNGQVQITKRTLIPFRRADGKVHGLVNLSLDVTAEKEAARQLQEAQRMHTAGQLAGGLAHDFNNLLSILQGNLVSMQRDPQTPPKMMRHIEPAVRATRRGADITRRLLAFAGRQPLSPTCIDLATLMHDCTTLIRSSLPGSIRLECQLDTPLWSPFADPGQLEDALVNLAFNARDAMPQGGLLRFSAENREIGSALILDEKVRHGRYVAIEVSDSGHGFSDEAISRAFEPFFTTHQGANSSGLGLSMVYGFAKQSSGYIALANNPAGGALITLLLPATEASLPEEEPALETRPATRPYHQGGLVLLVDDEDDVREVVRNQLIEQGYQVIESADGAEAAQLIDALPSLDALVSDVVMPGEISGFALARQLRRRQPGARIVLISGYAQRRSEPFSDCAALPLLSKPFGREQLLDALSSDAATAALLLSADPESLHSKDTNQESED